MTKEKVFIFDTTLRDGAQTEGVDFSIEDKNKIANVLSDIESITSRVGGQEPIQLILNFFLNLLKLKALLCLWYDKNRQECR